MLLPKQYLTYFCPSKNIIHVLIPYRNNISAAKKKYFV